MYQGSGSIEGVEVRYFHGGDLPAAAETMATFFERIAWQEGWQPGGHLRAHGNASIYFAAYVSGELAGGMQVVLPAPGEPFPFHDVA